MSTTPTITAERISEIEREYINRDWETFTNDDLGELLRLARLGLWAQEYGIPALEHYQSAHYDLSNRACQHDGVASRALAALPAAEKKGDE